MFINGTRPPNNTRLKITGDQAGTHPVWTGKIRDTAAQTAAYFAALTWVTRIDASLTQGNHPDRDKTTGQPLTPLDEGVRAMLADSLVMTESPGQACLRPNPAQPDSKGQGAVWGGQTCRCLAGLDTLARRRAGEKNQATVSAEVV
jgi:hypothetical protein